MTLGQELGTRAGLRNQNSNPGPGPHRYRRRMKQSTTPATASASKASTSMSRRLVRGFMGEAGEHLKRSDGFVSIRESRFRATSN